MELEEVSTTSFSEGKQPSIINITDDEKDSPIVSCAKKLYDDATKCCGEDITVAIEKCTQCIQILEGIQDNTDSGVVTLLVYGYKLRGSLYAKTRKLSDAKSDYNKWCQLAPNDPQAFSSVAGIHFLLNNFEQCAKDYKKSLVLRNDLDLPLSPDLLGNIYYNLGLAYKSSGCYAAAIHWFSKSLQSKPGFKLADKNLKLMRLIRSVKSKDVLGKQIRRLEIKSDDDGDKQSLKLNLLRTIIHYYLSYAAVQSLNQSQDDGFSRALLSAPFARASHSPFHSFPQTPLSPNSGAPNIHESVMRVSGDLITYFTGIPVPSMQTYMDQHGLHIESLPPDRTTRLAINFVVEFALNYKSLEVFLSMNESAYVQHQRMELVENAESNEDQIKNASANISVKAHPTSPSLQPSQSDVFERNDLTTEDLDVTEGFVPSLKGSKYYALLTPEQLAELHQVLPRYARGQDWELAYSTREHGVALQTFYGNTGWVGPNIIIIQDSEGAIFGGFSSISWTTEKMYQGTGDTFVYTFKSGKLETFKWTKKNDYFILAREDSIGFGGGGHFAIHLSADFQTGSSGDCTTYGSPCLAMSEDFDVYCMECYYIPEICTHESEKGYYMRIKDSVLV